MIRRSLAKAAWFFQILAPLAMLVNAARADIGITWTKVWPPVSDGTHNPWNGYHSVRWDAYSGKLWMYTTPVGGAAPGIYSERLHYFDPVALTDTNLGDNGQTLGTGCLISSSTWPASGHPYGQFWIDGIRHRVRLTNVTGCNVISLGDWYYQIPSSLPPATTPVSWTEQFPPGMILSLAAHDFWNVLNSDTLSADLPATGTGSDQLNLTHPSYAANRDFYKIDSEIVRIVSGGDLYLRTASGGPGANPLIIERGLFGTTPAAHAAATATVTRVEGAPQTGQIVHDTFHDAYFWYGNNARDFYGRLYVKCETGGTLTAAQTSVGCSTPNDWIDITPQSICGDASACTASGESAGSGKGNVPKGWYYPSMAYDDTTHKLLTWGGGYGSTAQQYTLFYDPTTFTWTRVTTTCSGAGCSGNSPAVDSANGDHLPVAYAMYQGKYFYHRSRHTLTYQPGGPTGTVEDWVLDPIAGTWTQISTGQGPPGTETMDVNPATGKLYAFATPDNGAHDAEIWEGTITGLTPSVPVISTSSLSTGRQYSPYSATLAASNSPTSWALASGTLPSGVTLNTSTGVISGTPVQGGGPWNITVTATNGGGTSDAASLALSITAASNGLGQSTENCIDVDGDRYGAGAPQLGPFSDLVVGANPKRVTSASHPFAVADMYYPIQITGADGVTLQTTNVARIIPSGSVDTLTLVSGGSGYTNGTHQLSITGNAGATMGWVIATVSGGVVTSLGPTWSSGSTSPPGKAWPSSNLLYEGSGYDGTITQIGTTELTAGLGAGSGAVITFTVNTSGAPIAELSDAVTSTNGTFVETGCLGPDADDNDATVHSTSDVIGVGSKYTDMAGYLTYFGYNPASNPSPGRVVYVDGGSGGTCSRIASPYTYSAGSACNSITAGIAAMSVGDALIVRAGTYSTPSGFTMKAGVSDGSGGCTTQTFYLAYPGERPVINTGNTFLVQGTEVSCFAWDGIAVVGVLGAKGFSSSTTACPSCPPRDHWIIRHTDIGFFTDPVFPQVYQRNLLIEHNYMHDGIANSGLDGHIIYLGSNTTDSHGATIRGNIFARSEDTCMHVNGPMTGVTIDSNLMYACSKSMQIQSGMSYSTVQNNVLHTIGRGIFINTYSAAPSGVYWLCHDQNHNVIRNNTVFNDTQSWDISLFVQPQGGFQTLFLEDYSESGYWCSNQIGSTPDNGHNTYDNNILTHSCGTKCFGNWNGGLAADFNPNHAAGITAYYSQHDSNGSGGFTYNLSAPLWMSSDTYRNNIWYTADVNDRIYALGNTGLNSSTTGGTTGFLAAATTTAALPGQGNNQFNVNPLFAAANPLWIGPGRWNLAVQAGSPAIGASYAADAPTYDIRGALRPATPTIGAYEYAPAGGSPVTPSMRVSGAVAYSGGRW